MIERTDEEWAAYWDGYDAALDEITASSKTMFPVDAASRTLIGWVVARVRHASRP